MHCKYFIAQKTARFIHSLLNSPNSYLSSILPHLLIKNTYLLSENYKYLMYRYDIHVHEWHGDVNNVCKKMETKCTLNDEHLANLCCVQKLIEMPDASDYELLPRSVMINMLYDTCISWAAIQQVSMLYMCVCVRVCVYIYACTHTYIYGYVRIYVYVCNMLRVWCVWMYIHCHCIISTPYYLYKLYVYEIKSIIRFFYV